MKKQILTLTFAMLVASLAGSTKHESSPRAEIDSGVGTYSVEVIQRVGPVAEPFG